ncbi:GntR family transcriptional regulator [Actinocorallia aurea]
MIKLRLVDHGERLPPERELARSLGISRVTLREAIRVLTEEGYVESRRGRTGGTFVLYRPRAPEAGDLARVAAGRTAELRDALVFRMAVETGAATHLAATGLASEDTERLVAALHAVNEAAPSDYRRLDVRFHLTIAELTGSPLLAAACAEARLRVTDLLNAIPVLRPNIAHAAVQHAAIVAAILARDPAGAHRAMAEHLDGTASLLRGFLG